MKKALIIILFLFISIQGYSQSSLIENHEKKEIGLSLSVNLLQTLINENGAYLDFNFLPSHYIGVNAAYIYPNKFFKVFVFSGNQATYPGTVWAGYVYRFYYKYEFSLAKKEKFNYISFQYLYKKLHFENQKFSNADGDNSNIFVRTETAKLKGFDIIIGKYFYIRESYPQLKIDLFYALGYRERSRKGTTISSSYGYYGSPIPVGDYSYNHNYIVPFLGVKLGLSF